MKLVGSLDKLRMTQSYPGFPIWAFDPRMERLPRSSAGAPGQARHRRTQYPPIETQSSVQQDDPVEKAARREDRLHRLMKLAGQKRSAIMCAEAVPWRCHRSLIADALTVRGIRVDDIMSMKRSQVHLLIPFARVQGHRITYPVRNRGGGRFPLVRFPECLRKYRKSKV